MARKKRKPTALDRDVAQYLYDLPVGKTATVEVHDPGYLGMARLKREGQMDVFLPGKIITIY
jgi:hypothetical protein